MLLTPSPVTNCHTFSDPFPSSVTYFMDGPLYSLGHSTKTSTTKRKHFFKILLMKRYLRCFLQLRASISDILSRRFNPKTNQYQLQCFGFAAILVYPTPRCTGWAIIVQFGFSKNNGGMLALQGAENMGSIELYRKFWSFPSAHFQIISMVLRELCHLVRDSCCCLDYSQQELVDAKNLCEIFINCMSVGNF